MPGAMLRGANVFEACSPAIDDPWRSDFSRELAWRDTGSNGLGPTEVVDFVRFQAPEAVKSALKHAVFPA